MLTALHIQDFVLIDTVALPIGEGLTALTGETGAGKSILLEALGLATGGRSARGAVRRGAERGIVTAVYEPLASHPVWALLAENGLDAEDDQIILKRIQNADGKGRAFINDQPVSVSLLREIGGALLEIHGQHDGHGFLSSATHRRLLDDFGGLTAKTAKVADLWRDWRGAAAALDERRAQRDAAIREADYLRHVVDELRTLSPQVGEETTLANRRAELMAAEKVIDDLAAARDALAEEGLEGRLSSASHRLSRASAALSADNPIGPALERIDRALSEIMEARAAVEEACERLQLDPEELERTEERLFALRAAARKHGQTPDQLQDFLQRASDALDSLDEGEAGFVALEEKVMTAQAAFQKGADALSNDRKAAASRLDKAVMNELAPLKLGKAVFSTCIASDADARGAEGIDTVEFMVATNPGAPAGPLKTIASGGELSRFVLAMKAALAAQENRTVIIFDEVDAGVGGAVADAVGERLSRLARDAQVLVVTHSPQVAARAGTHWLVEKDQSDEDTITHVRVLDAAARVEEIARMLSGASVTSEARAAAATLLASPMPPTAKSKAAKSSSRKTKTTKISTDVEKPKKRSARKTG